MLHYKTPPERALTDAVENFPNATITMIYVINPTNSVLDVEASGLPVPEDWHGNLKNEQLPSRQQPRPSQQTTISTSRLSRKSVNHHERSLRMLTSTTLIKSVWGVTADQESTVQFSEVSPR